MIKRIIFLRETRFNLRDYQRLGIELLKENGFNVEVWELTPVLYPQLFKNYKPPDEFSYDGLFLCHDEQEMCDKLLNLSQDDFVINLLVYNLRNLGFYKSLGKSRADYAVFCANILPTPIVRGGLVSTLFEKFKEIASFRRLEAWKYLLIKKLPCRFFGVKPASLILAGGDKCKSSEYNFPISENSEFLWIHTLDYDLYLEEKDSVNTEKPYAVFLDEFLPFHPDYAICGAKPYVDENRYYPLLNKFFDLVEKETGLEVIIAVHPRSNYENLGNFFKGRTCIKGETIKLVKESKLVLGHASTAVNFTNLFYKPVIFMIYSDLDKNFEGDAIVEFAKSFGKKPIFIDQNNNIDWEQEFKVSKSHYDNYRRDYIKTERSEDLPFWQIVANRLKSGF